MKLKLTEAKLREMVSALLKENAFGLDDYFPDGDELISSVGIDIVLSSSRGLNKQTLKELLMDVDSAVSEAIMKYGVKFESIDINHLMPK